MADLTWMAWKVSDTCMSIRKKEREPRPGCQNHSSVKDHESTMKEEEGSVLAEFRLGGRTEAKGGVARDGRCEGWKVREMQGERDGIQEVHFERH